MRTLKKHQPMGTNIPVGPQFDHARSDSIVDWGPPRLAAKLALDLAEAWCVKEAHNALDHAYGMFCDAAEVEVIVAMGSEPSTRGTRGRLPKEVWASLIEPVRSTAIPLNELRSKEIDIVQLCRDICVEGIVLANSPTPDDRLHQMHDQIRNYSTSDTRVEVTQMVKDVTMLACGLERRY